MAFEELNQQIEKGDYLASYQLAERLRNSGTPITTIRSSIYNNFLRLDTDRRQELIRTFKGYGLEGWLKL